MLSMTAAIPEQHIFRTCCSVALKLQRQQSLGLRICALINPARARAVPPHEQALSHFNDGDRVVVLGDVQSSPYPDLSAVKLRAPGGPVPITIFTGFLGSGKTTVLNHLLSGQKDKKFAVIENEFGEVPIDNELLHNSALGMAEQVIVMENGCMCCTVRGDLLGAFDAIRRQMETGSPLDAVLVETTGMADPVPIVRTVRQTPDIAKYFQLDGTITLVDARTIIDRLEECAGGNDDQERHSQIAFADKILLNKLDLVSDQEVAEVWSRIRSYNSSAPIVSSVKGVVPASELTNIGAYDMDQIAFVEESHGEGHGGAHEGGHDCQEDHGAGLGHGGGHEGGDDGQEEHGSSGHIHGHGHSASSRHDSQIGSFSIVRKGVEVEPLAFARWVRVISTLPEDKGKLYRSKGVLAAVGRQRKLIFHAVADVTETSDGPDWKADDERGIKIVFIGKKLARKEIEERFLQILQPTARRLRPALKSPVLASETVTIAALAQAGLLQRALLGCWSKDAACLSQCSAGLRDALYSPEAHTAFQSAAADLPAADPRGLHTTEGQLWLHGLLPMRSVRQYALSWRKANVKLNMPTSAEYLFGEPLRFDDLADVEAAAVMWQELAEMENSDTVNFVVEFKWRPETMQSFFDVPGSATNSALVKLCVEDPSGDSELDDDLKFRVNLNPESGAEEGAMKNMHRLSLQLVGGKSSFKVYQIFFHTIDPTYQVHINVPDHRQPIFPTKEVFHQWHPVMAGLKRRPRLRFLLRLKPMDSGPLDAMCGCCG
ncbi:unnamed protein product [Polarella glacialis]|uniref:CobW C-terminal domain-containing protein n=1 Tax=Polarella glacialis TaxID=89957 RepID=A0A813G2P0_POLGL|nr:unnamed protein product [Polarella glacialis]